MGKGIIVSGRTAVICVMLSAAVLPMKPLCADGARDRNTYAMSAPWMACGEEDEYETEGRCGGRGREDSVGWRIEGDTLRIWGNGEMTENWNTLYKIRESIRCAKVRAVVIEEGIMTVPDKLLFNMETVESVRLPEGLRRIGDGTFEDCGLKGELVLPERLTEIGDYAFSRCKGVEGVQFPKSLRRIGEWAFADCGLKGKLVLPENVQEIGEAAFQSCYKIKHVTVLCDGKGIDRDAFSGCSGYDIDGYGIESVVLGDGVKTVTLHEICVSGLKELYVSASVEDFLGSGHLDHDTKVTIAEGNRRYRMEDGVLYDMRDSAVLKCDVAKRGKIVIPEWVRRVGDYAFDRCRRITEVEMPGVREN